MSGRAFLELFRRSNSAYPALRDAQVVGHVVRVARSGFVDVDVGFRSPQTIPATELGSTPPSVGDKHTFVVQSLETPLGEMELDTATRDSHRQVEAVWDEIMRAHKLMMPVKGRILNAVNSGFAVGIGGFVAFLPGSRVSGGQVQVGTLQDFKIMSLVEETRNVVVSCTEDGRELDTVLKHRRLQSAVAGLETGSDRRGSRVLLGKRITSAGGETSPLLARVRAINAERSRQVSSPSAPSQPSGQQQAASSSSSA